MLVLPLTLLLLLSVLASFLSFELLLVEFHAEIFNELLLSPPAFFLCFKSLEDNCLLCFEFFALLLDLDLHLLLLLIELLVLSVLHLLRDLLVRASLRLLSESNHHVAVRHLLLLFLILELTSQPSNQFRAVLIDSLLAHLLSWFII